MVSVDGKPYVYLGPALYQRFSLLTYHTHPRASAGARNSKSRRRRFSRVWLYQKYYSECSVVSLAQYTYLVCLCPLSRHCTFAQLGLRHKANTRERASSLSISAIDGLWRKGDRENWQHGGPSHKEVVWTCLDNYPLRTFL